MCNPSFLLSGEREEHQRVFLTYDARTTSRPQGEIDMEPTGCSIWNERSSPKVSLSNAELGACEYMVTKGKDDRFSSFKLWAFESIVRGNPGLYTGLSLAPVLTSFSQVIWPDEGSR
jgi:hypothetical protein